jgi:hypothetical protein
MSVCEVRIVGSMVLTFLFYLSVSRPLLTCLHLFPVNPIFVPVYGFPDSDFISIINIKVKAREGLSPPIPFASQGR